MYVVPKPGLAVSDPFVGDVLPAQGRQVEANQYWFRRINDGDVTEGEAPVEAPVAEPIATQAVHTEEAE